ncbi:CPBP family intramembrane glutamic endopeptidase [Paraflavisolibacter sp. H34]|uniref:CPBP family intramembrane glutamic endopeptidase n=1 Tax=Huijunlia imazamoxiresistens TaxID=3127457 RepID=UPI00301617C7
MQSYLKTRPVWIQLLVFLGLAFGCMMVISVIAATVLSSLTGISLTDLQDVSNWDVRHPGLLFYIRGMLLAQFLGLFVIPCLLFAYYSDPQPLDYLGVRPPTHNSYWVLGIAIMILAVPLVEYLGLLNHRIDFGKDLHDWIQAKEKEAMTQIEVMITRPSLRDLLLNLVFIALFAGIGEELLFRGVLQRLFIRAFRSPWAGILVTAFLFSAIHMQFLGFLPRFFLGILLGAIYWYSGSLLAAMAAHFVYDGFFIVLAYRNPDLVKKSDATLFDPSTLVFFALGSALAVAAALWLMKKKSQTTYARVYQNDDTPSRHNFTF